MKIQFVEPPSSCNIDGKSGGNLKFLPDPDSWTSGHEAKMSREFSCLSSSLQGILCQVRSLFDSALRNVTLLSLSLLLLFFSLLFSGMFISQQLGWFYQSQKFFLFNYFYRLPNPNHYHSSSFEPPEFTSLRMYKTLKSELKLSFLVVIIWKQWWMSSHNYTGSLFGLYQFSIKPSIFLFKKNLLHIGPLYKFLFVAYVPLCFPVYWQNRQWTLSESERQLSLN